MQCPRCAELEREKASFKNFHRALCERFDYAHDEVDWQRDQISLIEWIAKRAAGEPRADQSIYSCGECGNDMPLNHEHSICDDCIHGFESAGETPKAHLCDCWKYEKTVCDICQGTDKGAATPAAPSQFCVFEDCDQQQMGGSQYCVSHHAIERMEAIQSNSIGCICRYVHKSDPMCTWQPLNSKGAAQS